MLITIGAFDGFHRGHAELLRLCRENSHGTDWGVVTFSPHPSEFMGYIHPLFTLKERGMISRILGIPHMYVLKFDDALMNLSPSDFWRLLRNRLNVDGIVMGSDFRFGHGRAGNAESLRDMAYSDGVKRVIIAPLLDKPEYSSSTIRDYIMAGNIGTAAELLGYPYFMVSSVIHGNERGRTMNFPTANLDINCGRVIPAYGVYSAGVWVNGSWHCGALSIGNNPTFGDIHSTRAELHILDFNEDIYGHEIITLILGRVRDIHTFADKGSLSLQIARDIDTCRDIFAREMSRESTRKFADAAVNLDIYTPEIINLTQGRAEKC